MARKYITAISIVLVSISSLAFAQSPSTGPAVSANPAPMRFEWLREGPADKCGNHCREWISASGAIVDSTLQDFETFARARDVRGATLVLDSPGGNVIPGLALGREIRRLEITTSVGKAVKIAAEQRSLISPRPSGNST